MSQIIVEHGKHGDQYYKADTVEERHKAALEMVKTRLNYYIVDPGKFENTYSYKRNGWAKIPKSEEEISKLETDEERVDARRTLASYKSYQKSHAESKHFYDKAKRAVKEEDGALAWEVIEERSGHEYEEISIERLS